MDGYRIRRRPDLLCGALHSNLYGSSLDVRPQQWTLRARALGKSRAGSAGARVLLASSESAAALLESDSSPGGSPRGNVHPGPARAAHWQEHARRDYQELQLLRDFNYNPALRGECESIYDRQI